LARVSDSTRKGKNTGKIKRPSGKKGNPYKTKKKIKPLDRRRGGDPDKDEKEEIRRTASIMGVET